MPWESLEAWILLLPKSSGSLVICPGGNTRGHTEGGMTCFALETIFNWSFQLCLFTLSFARTASTPNSDSFLFLLFFQKVEIGHNKTIIVQWCCNNILLRNIRSVFCWEIRRPRRLLLRRLIYYSPCVMLFYCEMKEFLLNISHAESFNNRHYSHNLSESNPTLYIHMFSMRVGPTYLICGFFQIWIFSQWCRTTFHLTVLCVARERAPRDEQVSCEGSYTQNDVMLSR